MTALADPTRSRLLLALERNELTVNELRSILQLPQSTISRHLKMLGAEGWVEARAEGTSRHYRLPPAQRGGNEPPLSARLRRAGSGEPPSLAHRPRRDSSYQRRRARRPTHAGGAR